MNKSFLSVIIAAGMVWGVSAQELSQTLYFDFGTITASQGTVTEGEDANGHHWNNITNNIAGDKYAAQGTVYDNLVNADNQPVGYRITLDTRFSTNGKSGGGGLMTPSAELLGDLAVATATEDYFFFEADQPKGEFTISGLVRSTPTASIFSAREKPMTPVPASTPWMASTLPPGRSRPQVAASGMTGKTRTLTKYWCLTMSSLTTTEK